MGQCPVCGSQETNIEFDAEFCIDCGFVVEGSEENQSPETTFLESNSDQVTSALDWKSRITAQDSSDENLIRLLTEVDNICDQLSVTAGDRKHAGDYVAQAWTSKFTHGRSIGAVSGSAVYLACRISNRARPLDKIADAARVCTSSLQKTHKAMGRILDLDLQPMHPLDFIPFIYRELDWSPTESSAKARLERLETIPAGNPAGTAAAAVYLERQDTDLPISYREIGEVAGLTKETIWRRAEDLRASEV